MTLSQTGNHFIQCTISSAADNQVHFTGHFLNHITGIHGTLCGMNDNLIATFNKYIYDVQQFAPYLSFSRSWIKNKKKFLFHIYLPFLLCLTVSFYPSVFCYYHTLFLFARQSKNYEVFINNICFHQCDSVTELFLNTVIKYVQQIK